MQKIVEILKYAEFGAITKTNKEINKSVFEGMILEDFLKMGF